MTRLGDPRGCVSSPATARAAPWRRSASATNQPAGARPRARRHHGQLSATGAPGAARLPSATTSVRATRRGSSAASAAATSRRRVLAKWFEVAPCLILLDEPTQGVDVGAREQVFSHHPHHVRDRAPRSSAPAPTTSSWPRSATASSSSAVAGSRLTLRGDGDFQVGHRRKLLSQRRTGDGEDGGGGRRDGRDQRTARRERGGKSGSTGPNVSAWSLPGRR